MRRSAGDVAGALEAATQAASRPIPEDRHFVHLEVYVWAAQCELARCALAAGDRPLALGAWANALASGRVPDTERAELEALLASAAKC
jgi:hypothetical protein